MKSKVRLEEGKTYDFLCLKAITISGEDFYVLQAPTGSRHLLSQTRYARYGIDPGSSVSCRIDKINCKNELFLEPEHPVYREGETYYFIVTGTVQEMGSNGEWEKTLWVEDALGNQIALPGKMEDKIRAGRIKLRIKRIYKGLPVPEYRR